MESSGNQRKEYIIITAIDLIHEKGIHNVSTKEIAKRVGVSEGIVFKNFPKKSDLMMAVLNNFSMYDRDMFQTAQEKTEDPVDAVLFYITKYLVYYENYPAITAVFQSLDLFNGQPELENEAKSIILNRLDFMNQLIIRAQNAGRIVDHVDSEIIADILYSVFKGMCVKWRLMGYKFSLVDRTKAAICTVINSLYPNQSIMKQ